MLVIIDMQEAYEDEFSKQKEQVELVITELRARIRHAKKYGETIVNLAHFGDGFTLPEINQVIQDYERTYHLSKTEWSGADCLISLIERKSIDPSYIELAGAFRDICILKTWEGLVAKGLRPSSISAQLSLATTSNWRQIEKYPQGFVREDLYEIQDRRGQPSKLKAINGGLTTKRR